MERNLNPRRLLAVARAQLMGQDISGEMRSVLDDIRRLSEQLGVEPRKLAEDQALHVLSDIADGEVSDGEEAQTYAHLAMNLIRSATEGIKKPQP